MIRFCCIALALMLLVIAPAVAQRRKQYSEDLQPLRQTFAAPPKKESRLVPVDRIVATNTVNDKVNSVLDSLDRFNSTRMFTDGFTVQIYSGQKKQEALEVNKTLSESTLGLQADIQFVQPKFRVIVGRYYTRLDAHRDLYRLRKLFSDAIIIPEKVPVR